MKNMPPSAPRFVADCPSSASRRQFLRAAAAAGVWAGLSRFAPAYAQTPHAGHTAPAASAMSAPATTARVVDLMIDKMDFRIGNRIGQAVTVNGSLPAPLLRFRQGQEVELRVTNRLKERASIHWHGILLPPEMDGVPGVSFKGIDPGETFVYRFPLKQYGTYWYHSHSGSQEQLGLYGPFIVDPAEAEPFAYASDHVVILSDWTFSDPMRLLAKLKKQSNFSNMQQRTLGDFFDDVSEKGFKRTWADRKEWGKMRMDPTDIADLTGTYFNYLLNGRPGAAPWTGIFKPGERVRLRFINAAATTHFDVRIPGLKMTVVQADGQHVKPVEVEEFRMGAAETYDVIVEPTEDRAYALFAETTDRSGFALGTLAPREGMMPQIPERRMRPLRTMADILSGGNELMNILAILVIAWAMGAVSQELKLSDFIQEQVGDNLPGWSIPVSLFIIASAVTYFIGEGWAAASLIMPFAISLAVSAGAGIPICVAAVITGGTFGDVTSPVAGMTNMSSSAVGADHMKYLKYASPYNFTALAVAAILFLVFGIIGGQSAK